MNQGACWTSVLRNVVVHLRIGLHNHERGRTQQVQVSVTTRRYRSSHPSRFEISDIMNYDRLRQHILDWQDRAHVDLLETLMLDLVDHCFADPRVDEVYASILKPEIFLETEAAGIELTISRDVWERS
ncbi:MAG TPA: dihydroneopterin aldolase [Acidiferrobacteraceae bacterium]|nr:dihydroneopterin aldolase [Acidiferrobacteraceae bacterium]